MKNRVFACLLLAVCLLACGNEKEPQPGGKTAPAIQVTVDSIGSAFVRLDIKVLNAEKAWLLALTGRETVSDPSQVRDRGTVFEPGIRIYEGLKPETEYTVYAVAGNAEGNLSSISKVTFQTWAGELYSWEDARSGVPFFADIALLYGFAKRSPQYWGKDRLKNFITWTDPDTGEEKWLFDAFLVLEGRTPSSDPPHTFMVGAKDWNDSSIGMLSANQEDARAFLDYWFQDDNGFKVIDRLVGEATGRIGPPKAAIKIIVMMPDIPVRERYNVASASTTYWGKVGGRQLDFSKAEDRRQAYYWYIDETRRRFYEEGFANIELGGFYIMSEELPSNRSGVGGNGGDRINGVLLDGWEVAYKAWDDIFPAVSDYIHQYHESLCWIPYRSAAGYRYWKEFGIDYAWMQPNYYWDTFGVNPMSSFFSQIATYDLAMELEFDDLMMPKPTDRSSSEYTKERGGTKVTETWEDYSKRWKGYVEGMQNAPVYGLKQLALYQDTDSFNHLRQSSDKVDKDAFNELCRLIANDPLKEKNR